eukprot:263809-Amphidinium_carterae.1
MQQKSTTLPINADVNAWYRTDSNGECTYPTFATEAEEAQAIEWGDSWDSEWYTHVCQVTPLVPQHEEESKAATGGMERPDTIESSIEPPKGRKDPIHQKSSLEPAGGTEETETPTHSTLVASSCTHTSWPMSSCPQASWQSLVLQQEAPWQSFKDLAGYSVLVVLDTACQRSVAPRTVLVSIPPELVTKAPEQERFRFGVGENVSSERACLVVQCERLGVDYAPDFAVHFSQVQTDIPFLLSRLAMQRLGAVISMGDGTCTLTSLKDQPCLPLHRVLGHLGLRFRLCAHTTPPEARNDITMNTHVCDAFLTHQLEDLPVMLPAIMTDETRRATQRLLNQSLPLAKQRTNLCGSDEIPRSITLGAYSQRGCGVTAATESHASLLQDAFVVARSRPPSMRMPFLSVTLTTGAVQAHHDDNCGVSTTMAFGEYTGGNLVIDGVEFSNNLYWVLFDGLHTHQVSPITGRRMSIPLYTPRHPGKLTSANVNRLAELQFPVNQWIRLRGWRALRGSALLPSSSTSTSASSANPLRWRVQGQCSAAVHILRGCPADSN